MEQTTAPTGVWEALWPIVQPALTPELVGAIAITLAGTHAVKMIAADVLPQVTLGAARWRAFCTIVSIIIGCISGTVIWLASDTTWAAVPIVALGSGPTWRLIQALLPARIAGALITSVDRYHRRDDC